jgi:hypothetical protein
MSGVHVNCPSCGATLAVPAQTTKRHIRCGRCKYKFDFSPQPKDAIEDVVASWLSDEEEAEPGLATAELMAGAEALAGGDSLLLDPEDPGPGAEIAGDSPVDDGGEKHLRVVNSDNRGVLLEFSASRLLEPAFRAAFPRQCMSCDVRAHLRAHVVIFSQQLVDSLSMEAEHSAGTLMLSNEEVRGLSGQEILDRLPRRPAHALLGLRHVQRLGQRLRADPGQPFHEQGLVPPVHPQPAARDGVRRRRGRGKHRRLRRA